MIRNLVLGACIVTALLVVPAASAHTYVSLNLREGCATRVQGPSGTHLFAIHGGAGEQFPACTNVVVDYSDPIPDVIPVLP